MLTPVLPVQLASNPLEKPSWRWINKGVSHALWACRQMKLEILHKGKPPQLTMTGIGVQEEIQLANLVVDRDVQVRQCCGC